MDDEYQYFLKITKKSSQCHVFNFDKWMENDINMTLWLKSQGDCIVVEKELLQLSCNELH